MYKYGIIRKREGGVDKSRAKSPTIIDLELVRRVKNQSFQQELNHLAKVGKSGRPSVIACYVPAPGARGCATPSEKCRIHP